MDSGNPTATRKLQKAGREKQRRERLSEQFLELGNTLDADRPKNDKATILTGTIQLLKDLTSDVNKLKAEHAVLSEESRELMQEKNDLREEKATLKSDIERLNAQCQQKLSSSLPWVAVDSVLPHPPSCQYPMPIPVPLAQIPIRPSIHPYQFFSTPNPGIFPNPCSTFIPYMTPNPAVEQPSTHYVSGALQPRSKTQVSGTQGVRNSSDKKREKRIDKAEDSDDVATNLELKTPGSTTDEDISSGENKGMKSRQKKRIGAEETSCSRCSSHSVQDSSSSSIVGGDAGNE